jgi:N12 class adenine-specific DNA methylase
MRLKRIAEAVMWLPGFAPEDDPVAVDGFAGQEWKGEIIAFPSKEARQSSFMTFWPGLNASVFDGLSGEVTKFEANCSAIVLLRKLEDEGRGPTTEERTILNRYTGWGGLPWAFNPDQVDSNRKIRVERLQTLLAEDEYESARASTNSAHYTSVEIIEAMWAAVRRLGFAGGRILEPSAGNGYFLGAMPREVAEKSTVTAIEIDQLSARLLTSLYGAHGVRVANDGFEVARLPADFFDLVISNVPFGNYQTPETRHVPFRDFLIHDYFFARALEVVRPGGLVAFITSAGTLDKSDTAARKYLANRARLLGSIRLPLQAFQKIANTEVTTDIVFLQKLKEGEAGNGDAWAEWPVEIPGSHIARDAKIPAWQWRNVRVCKWFAERPEWIVGKLTLAENGYGKANACTFEGDIGAALLERVALLPEGVYRDVEQTRDRSEGCAEVRVLAGNFVKPGAYKLVDGKVAVSEGHELRVVEGRLSARAVERIKGMIEIRDAARKLVAAQAGTDDDTLLAIYRVVLNAAYDAFSAKCGHIHAKANRLAFRGDPDLPLLLSLERWDEETQTAEKMDIFHRRTVGAARQIECCETPEEALIASIQQTGRVSVARMEALLGQPGYEFIPQLQEVGAIFLNPDSGSWETADTYLAGNVRQKLMFAENAGRKFASNVEALKAVIPDDLAPHEIGARIGSVWIPATDYQAFLDEIMECEGNRVEFNATAGAWQIDPNHTARWSVAATQTYGTERVGALTLFEQALNQQVPTVTDPAPDDRSKRIVNQKETIAAREKLQELREKFQEWLWLDDERTQRLVRLYNDQFNCIVQRRYDGKHLVLPGFSQVYRLHDHQRDAIWRVVSCKSNTLLAHVVGAGKTLTMICAGMELRRLGVAGKPCYVVPNHMLEQFAAEFLRAYPGANILMASKDDLQGDKRRTLLSRIATGDWDGVLITHSSFERIKLGDGFIEDFIQKQIDEIEQAIRDARQDRGNRIVKELERAKKVWLARLTKLAAREKKDDVLTFDELGIDWLFVDEAHLFKNLYRFTKMTRVAGLPNSNSERAFDMFLKTRCVMARHHGRAGVAFATGTPVSNSMAEMWTMQRYLQPDTLSAFRLQQFDTWAGNFGESVTALELAPDGRGYRMHTRFARFVNLPELMSMFGQVADIRTAEMLKLPVPRALKETATAKPTLELKAYVQTLVERSEAIRNGTVTPQQDNMLAVTGDGRKAALDMRLVDPFAEDYEGSKTNQCAEKVFGVWKETASTRGTQIVFCDLSTPVENGRFSVYQDLRRKLIEMGVPVADIAFIHDYDSDSQKEELFKAVREGRVRVVLGSTQKMGVGTNVQTRLAALHHLDAPWRPSDVEQREGRIIRQGNLNEEVRIHRYVTEGSFDAYIWQTLETKARFIAQVMQGNTGMRSAEDVELAALSYAEVKALASGNPLVLEKAGVDTELAKLSLLKSQWEQQQWRNKSELAALPGRIECIQQRIAGMEGDVANRQNVTGDSFRMQIDGTWYLDRTEVTRQLVLRFSVVKPGDTRVIGLFGGFRMAIRSHVKRDFGKRLVLLGNVEHEAGHTDNPNGFIRVLENLMNRMEQRLAEDRDYLARTEKRMSDLKAEIAKQFDKADRLAWLAFRQKEIDAALDLSKGDTSAVDEEDPSETV